MTILNEQASGLSPEEALYHDWQYDLARRISQVLTERGMTQRELAKRARLTEAQVSALMHCAANPTLAMLARLSVALERDVLTWIDADAEQPRNGTTNASRNRSMAA